MGSLRRVPVRLSLVVGVLGSPSGPEVGSWAWCAGCGWTERRTDGCAGRSAGSRSEVSVEGARRIPRGSTLDLALASVFMHSAYHCHIVRIFG